MKHSTFPLLAILTLGSCTSSSGDPLADREKVTYRDRNNDGKVDIENHTYSGVADADWQLLDNDYDGRYEKKILFGIGVIESAVDIPVPTGVKITKTP